MKQVESIQLIDEEIGLENLPDRLREVAKLRVEHQEISLKELRWFLQGLYLNQV